MKTLKVNSLVALTLTTLAVAIAIVGTSLPINAEEEISHAVPEEEISHAVPEEEISHAVPNVSGVFSTVLDLLEVEIPMTPVDKPVVGHHPKICLNTCFPCLTDADCTLVPGDRCRHISYCP